MPNATVYNKSFEHVDDKTAALCRVSPARPKNSLKIPPAQFTNDTVTKLSFPPPCPASKTLPIRPNPKSMLTKGLEHRKIKVFDFQFQNCIHFIFQLRNAKSDNTKTRLCTQMPRPQTKNDSCR